MRTTTESGRVRYGEHREEMTYSAGDRGTGLVRFVTWVLGVEAMLLVALGVSGLGGTTSPDGRPTPTAPPPVPELLGFRASPAHSVLLLVTGLLALGALWLPVWRRTFATAQAGAYLLITAAGLLLAVTAPPSSAWHLHPADHLLHGLLCLLGLALLLLGRHTHPARRTGRHGPHTSASPTPEPPATTDPR